MRPVLAIIQARMGSSRLPGKVLLDLAGEPMLARVMHRVNRAREVDATLVATTTNPRDDRVVDLCRDRGWCFFRGDEADVLDRYYRAAAEYQAGAVVRITSDCPLIDPGLIDLVIREFRGRYPEIDYCSNVFPQRTYPRGLDTEILSFHALEQCWASEQARAIREHVTLHILRNHGLFRICAVKTEPDLSAHRWTVDTSEDYRFIRCIYDHFRGDRFTWEEVLTFLRGNPQILEINRDIRQKEI
jgi:spore coat polysaccharide biosynthesis protein SpsF